MERLENADRLGLAPNLSVGIILSQWKPSPKEPRPWLGGTDFIDRTSNLFFGRRCGLRIFSASGTRKGIALYWVSGLGSVVGQVGVRPAV